MTGDLKFPIGFEQHRGVQKAQPLRTGELVTLLEETYGDRLMWNLLTMGPEIDGRALPDDTVSNFYVMLSLYGWDIAKVPAQDALIVAAQKRAYHPVRDWLYSFELDDSIEPVLLDSVASDYLGTSDPLFDAILAATLIGAVARAMHPGTKFDGVCTLRGPMGGRKSSWWKALASPPFFCDTFQEKDQDLFLAIHQSWFYELAELDFQTTRRSPGRMRGIISSSTDTFRSPYGKAMCRSERAGIIVGTANGDSFLNDPEGSRRFWVIDVENDEQSPLDVDRVAKDRARIFKAALLAWRNGRKPMLTPAQQAESNARNVNNTVELQFIGQLARWTEGPGCPPEFTTDTALSQSLYRSRDNIRQSDLNAAGHALKALGFVKDKHQQRKDGKKLPRMWRRASSASSE